MGNVINNNGDIVVSNDSIQLRANEGGQAMDHADVDQNFEILRREHNTVVSDYNSLLSDFNAHVGSNSSTDHPTATTASHGFMSSTHVAKLNGIASNANNYSLPKATSSALGGVKIGSNINVSNGVISIDDHYTFRAAASFMNESIQPLDGGVGNNSSQDNYPFNHIDRDQAIDGSRKNILVSGFSIDSYGHIVNIETMDATPATMLNYGVIRLGNTVTADSDHRLNLNLGKVTTPEDNDVEGGLAIDSSTGALGHKLMPTLETPVVPPSFEEAVTDENGNVEIITTSYIPAITKLVHDGYGHVGEIEWDYYEQKDYILPEASTTRLGGIRLGNSLSAGSDGKVHVGVSAIRDGAVDQAYDIFTESRIYPNPNGVDSQEPGTAHRINISEQRYADLTLDNHNSPGPYENNFYFARFGPLVHMTFRLKPFPDNFNYIGEDGFDSVSKEYQVHVGYVRLGPLPYESVFDSRGIWQPDPNYLKQGDTPFYGSGSPNLSSDNVNYESAGFVPTRDCAPFSCEISRFDVNFGSNWVKATYLTLRANFKIEIMPNQDIIGSATYVTSDTGVNGAGIYYQDNQILT